MLAKDNDRMLDVSFDQIEHHGNAMEMVRKFETELKHYNDVVFGRTQSPVSEGISSMYEISVVY